LVTITPPLSMTKPVPLPAVETPRTRTGTTLSFAAA
jgi:hypothetical protein